MSKKHRISDLIELFNQSFYDKYNTQLVKGNAEPIYLPADHGDLDIDAKPFAQVVFAHGYYASALHEIAHWCLAGEERRKQVDFGYWYCPDGRNAKQQAAFQQAEIKPQAIEWGLCIAAGCQFNVSCDNLSGDEYGRQPDRFAFEQDIIAQVNNYLECGFPVRARQLMMRLSEFYGTEQVQHIEQFRPSQRVECG